MLIASLAANLRAMRAAVPQAVLDTFFNNLLAAADRGTALLRAVSDRAFAKAQTNLHMPALSWPNDGVLNRVDAAPMVSRCQRIRLVAANAASPLTAIRNCHRTGCSASSGQRLFALYMLQAELTQQVYVYSTASSELAVPAPAKLCPGDVLLREPGIRFDMRCDKLAGWSAVRKFLRAGADQAPVSLNALGEQDMTDWDCPADTPNMRAGCNVTSKRRVSVLATNLDPGDFHVACFGNRHHARWNIEESFKRQKHRNHTPKPSPA